MKSPFPGMDPFIESYKWRGFHLLLIAQSMRMLFPQLPERYLIEVEVGSQANDLILGRQKDYRPDLGIVENDKPVKTLSTNRGKATATITPPQQTTAIEDAHLRTLTIRTVEGGELVTAIEILSPTNKVGTDRRKYQRKREDLIASEVHVVEIDLLRGGKPPYVDPAWDIKTYSFQKIDSIAKTISFWSVNLMEKLPIIAIPLLPEDGDIALDLQAAFENVYRESGYSRSLNYNLEELKPAPTESERSEIQNVLSNSSM